MFQVNDDASRSAPRAPGTALKMSSNERVIKIRLVKLETLASPDRRGKPLELFKTDVDPGLQELIERTLGTVADNHGLHIAKLTARKPEQLQIGALRVLKDCLLDNLE